MPFNVVHLLYKNSLLTAIAQKEKEEQEKKENERKEQEERNQAARERQMQQMKGPIRSAIPIKQPEQKPVQMPSQSSKMTDSRLSGAAMDEIEDMFEGGF